MLKPEDRPRGSRRRGRRTVPLVPFDLVRSPGFLWGRGRRTVPLVPQAVCQHGVALRGPAVADGQVDSLFLSHQDQDLFRPGHAGVEEIALEHDVVGHHEGHDDDGVFAPLALVDGAGVGQDELVQLGDVIGDIPAVEVDLELPLLHIHMADHADVPVEDLLVVVIADLHDLVVQAVLGAAPAQADSRRIQDLLQLLVEIGGPDGAPLHGGQNLDVADPVRVIVAGQVLRHILHDQIRRLLGRLPPRKKEIAVPAAAYVGPLSPVDPVGIHDDPAALGLAEDPGQLHDRDRPAPDDVREDIAGADRGQLVHVPPG